MNMTMIATLSPEKINRIAEVLKVIAHPIRLSILEKLQQEERVTVSSFSEALGIDQPVISHHLGKMKDKNILEAERESRKIYYSLKDREILNIFRCMEKCDLYS